MGDAIFSRYLVCGCLLGLAVASPAVAQPDWSVNAAAFESSLSATVRVNLDGALTAGESDLLAAFVGGEVRGVAPPSAVGNELLHFLLVYANGQGETVTFRYYHAASEVVCTVSETIQFVPNAVLGALSDPLRLAASCAGATGSATPIEPATFQLKALYPNPAVGTVNVSLRSERAGHAGFMIFDTAGRLVLQHAAVLAHGANQVVLPTASLASGTYLLMSHAGDGRQSRSFSVRRP